MNNDLKSNMTNNAGKVVTVFGGSGFLGRHVVGALTKKGFQVRVGVRRPDLAFHLKPLGDVGQIQSVQANLRFPWSVERAIEGSDAVVNLVGIISETGNQKFQNVQCDGAGAIAQLCKTNNVPLVHLSAIGADAQSKSDYCNSKGRGEALIRKIDKSVIILRPSIIFGINDGFFNKFAKMAKFSPFLPLIGGGKTKFQPVYVGDVAKAVVLGVEGKLSAGKIYELGGSQILTFRQCMELMARITGKKSTFITIPWTMARIIAKLTQWIPGAPVKLDQIKILESDNIVSQNANRQKRNLEGMGIEAKSLAAILPTYLVRFRAHGQFSRGPYSPIENI